MIEVEAEETLEEIDETKRFSHVQIPAELGNHGPQGTLKITSLNVAGINDDRKRGELFTWLSLSGADIVLIQEHKAASVDIVNKWMWGRKWHYIFSCAGNSTAGSAIMVRESLGLSDITWRDHQDGRTTSIEFKWCGTRWKLVSAYAPAEAVERPPYLAGLEAIIREQEEEDEEGILDTEDDETASLILGGDWNCVPNPVLDKRGGNPSAGTTGMNEITTMMASLDLEDIWRTLHPDEKQTTWERNGVACRLDRFLTDSSKRHWISEVHHQLCPFSDHKAVVLALSPPGKVKIGKGSWSLNRRVLGMTRFQEAVRKEIENIKKNPINPVAWDLFKTRVRKLGKKFGSILKQTDEKEEIKAKNRLEALEDMMSQDPSEETKRDYYKATAALKEVNRRKVEGCRTRARIREIHEGTRPSKFFSAMEGRRKEAQTIHCLSDAEGAHTTTEEILESATKFYKELYSETVESPEDEQTVLDCIQRKFKEEEANALDADINVGEVNEAMGRCGKNRSPGPDGIVGEFYATFKEELAPVMLELFRNILADNTLTESQKEATISLLYKKGERSDVRNYRPISLLNVDIKILTKILSNSLGPMLDAIIGPGQTCVKGRYIQENIRTLLDVVYDLRVTKKPGAILLLDQEKAFDRISWSYLKAVLGKMGVGPVFLKWVSLLYHEPSARLKINNTLGEMFVIKRGVRQGDPLSPRCM